MDKEEYQLKRSIMVLLIELSLMDKILNENEVIFIRDIAQRIRLSNDEIEEIIFNHKHTNLELPKSEQERMAILYYLLFLMKIDGNAVDEEQRLVRQIGVKLGFRDNMVDSMIEVIKKNENKRIPPESLLNTIKKYLN